MKGGYFLRNGQFGKEEEQLFTLRELSGRAEGFSEFFRAEHNEVLFAESISSHLYRTATAMGFDLTGILDREGRILRKDVSRLLNKNKLYQAARVEIQIFPAGETLQVTLSASEIEKGYYPEKEPGLLISIYRDHLKGADITNCLAPYHSFAQLSARRVAAETDQPSLILLNQHGFACESSGGSFAYINGEEVFLPHENCGGYRCAILNEVVRSVKNAGFVPVMKENITPEELLQAEELFLYDACNGIQKVLGLEGQRFFSTKSRLIGEKLTNLALLDRKNKETGLKTEI